eukprot:jgi/Orpsp1_1/1176787/evm.model.c7180000059008.1
MQLLQKKRHYFFECKKRQANRMKNKNSKYIRRNNKRKYSKARHYANFITNNKYDTTRADIFTQ